MRVFTSLFVLLLVILSSITSSAQSMRKVLEPSAENAAAAAKLPAGVFKLAPRGMFDSESNELNIRGGGAYYSFKTQSHDYNRIPQIQLQRGWLSVGFAGADYGLINDLGPIPLDSVGAETGPVRILLDYKVLADELPARDETLRLRRGLEIGGVMFTNRVDAVAGHSYALRAILFREADTLVVFHVAEIAADGSATIFWKHVEDFDVPKLTRATNEERIERAKSALSRLGLSDVAVTFDVPRSAIVLKGIVPKGRMSVAVMAVREAVHANVVNEMTESKGSPQ